MSKDYTLETKEKVKLAVTAYWKGAAGVYRIVIGSLAIENINEFEKILNKFGPQKVAAAIDVVNNKVIIRGRKKGTDLSPEELADRVVKLGAERLVVTDVERNGMMSGPNVELSKNIALRTGVKVTLSGGVRDKDDLFKIKDVMDSGVDSVIVGRALYENKFPCQRLWRVAEHGIFT
ncbi:MAG TPA: HisA/HisF-related TIM barrel protein [Ignavibacteriales bacterium]|nr:HisA/HisF-related TIM barrel protein [Ignavibacteriales bacterium]